MPRLWQQVCNAHASDPLARAPLRTARLRVAQAALQFFANAVARAAVKSRIKSVQNIKKITSAMKMVAASKMRKAQAAQQQAVGMPTTFMKLFGEHTGKTHLCSCGCAIHTTSACCRPQCGHGWHQTLPHSTGRAACLVQHVATALTADRLRQGGHTSSGHRLRKRARVRADLPVRKTVNVPISSDKGMCGGINTNVAKLAAGCIKVDMQGVKCFQ
jgi:ATP synthase